MRYEQSDAFLYNCFFSQQANCKAHTTFLFHFLCASKVVERSQTRSLDASPVGDGDEAVIRGYAQRYLKEIIDMLDIVPRQMLLIFKMQVNVMHQYQHYHH